MRDSPIVRPVPPQAYMQMMGLRPALHWTSWCIKYLLIFTVTSGLLVGVAKYRFPRSGAILPHCDGTLLFVFFLVYSVTTITFTFAVTAPCSKGRQDAQHIWA